jgi:hypothetical protein
MDLRRLAVPDRIADDGVTVHHDLRSLDRVNAGATRDHQSVFALLNDFAALVDELRRKDNDAPAVTALRRPHAFDAKFHMQRVADLDGPTKSHVQPSDMPGRKR